MLKPHKQQQVLSELSSEAAEKMSSCPTSGANVSGDVNDETKHEINNYLIEPVIDEAEDPLKWWRNKELQYRHLAILARKYLCCYATCLSAKNFDHGACCRQPFPLSKYLSEDGVNILNFLLRNS